MYAFYSLLVYIFYTVFKKEEEAALEGASGEALEVCGHSGQTPIDILIYAFSIVCMKYVQTSLGRKI